MNADRLMAHFERISDAPDAVGRLRRFILDWRSGGSWLSRIQGKALQLIFLHSTEWLSKPQAKCTRFVCQTPGRG